MPSTVNLTNPVNTGSSLTTGLTAWWRCVPNGTYTTTLTDFIGGNVLTMAGNAGITSSGFTTPASKIMVFSDFGTPGKADAPDAAAWDIAASTGNFTLSAWVYFTDVTSGFFLQQWTGSYDNWYWYYEAGSGGALVLTFSRATGSTFEGAGWAWNPTISTWHHLVVTKSGNDYKQYVDGSQIGSTWTQAHTWVNKTGVLRVGNYDGVSGYDMSGSVDNIKIYNRALTGAEITSLRADDISNNLETLNWITANGGLELGGESLASIQQLGSASGSLELGGESLVSVTSVHYISDGGLELGGQSLASIQQLGSASGGLELGGESLTSMVVDHYVYSASGSLELGGESPAYGSTYEITTDFEWNVLSTVEIDLSFSWDLGRRILRYYQIQGECQTPPVCEITGTSTDDENCSVGGSQMLLSIAAFDLSDLCTRLKQRFLNYPLQWPIASIRRFSRPVYTTDIDFEEESGIDHSCNNFELVEYCYIPECLDFCIDADREAQTGITVEVIDTFLTYVGSGGLSFSGLTEPYLRPVQELKLSGSSEVICSNYSYTPSTGLELGGDSISSSSEVAYNYTSSGELTLGGSIQSQFYSLGTIETEIETIAELEFVEGILGLEEEIDSPTLVSDTGTVAANCNCDPVSISLFFSHNLNSSALLKDFLVRNRQTLPSSFNLIYSTNDSMWRKSYHFKGVGTEAGVTEYWTIVFEWGCVSSIGPETLGGVTWKFSTLISRIKRKNSDYNKSETRILYIFPTSTVCKRNEVDFKFKINTISGDVTLPENFTVSSQILTDEIGLFGGTWLNSPELKINVSELDTSVVDPTLDIKPIFPT